MAKKKKYNPTKILGIAAIAGGLWYLIRLNKKANDTQAAAGNS